MLRRDLHHGLLALVVATWLVPQAAGAQASPPFVSALTQFAVALGGSYGDEGPQAMAALDAMARALPEWDRELGALETRARGATADGQAHADLARAYLLRARRIEAVRELETAVRLDATRSDTALLLGLTQWTAGHRSEAAAAFRSAWSRNPSSPVAAYWLFQSDPSDPGLVTSDDPVVREASGARIDRDARALAALTDAYQRALTQAARPPLPFAVFPPPPPDVGDAPIFLPAAYANGYALLRAGNAAAALAQFRQAALSDPLISDTALRSPAMVAGSAALRQGRIAAAREQFRMAVALVPASSEAHRLYAIACLFDFDLEQSIAELDAATRLRPTDERARMLLARLLAQQGNLARAEALFKDTVTTLPDSALARLWLGSTLISANREGEGAIALTDAAARQPIAGEARLLMTIGTLHQNTGDGDAAAAAWMRSILVNPNVAETHVRLARVYHEQEKPQQAFAEYVAALLIDPAEPNAYMGIGQLHLDAGRYADAVIALQRLVRLQPTFNEAHYALGTALLRTGRTEDGNRELAEYARVQAQMAEERRRTLTVDVLKQEAAVRTSEGAFDRAEGVWKQVIALEPAVASHHASLGALLVRANRLDAAAASFERAAALGGGPDVYRQLASIYARLGRQRESVAAREKYEGALLAPPAGGAPR